VLGLVIIETAAVALLGALVVSLLHSYAVSLRQLESVAAVEDGTADPDGPGPRTPGRQADVTVRTPGARDERTAPSAPDVVGVTPAGEEIVVSPTRKAGHTLIAFLTSGWGSSATFWGALADPARLGLPHDVQVVVVTKGPESESPGPLVGRLGPDVPVVMSTGAWGDYEVPGSPYFVLVDGYAGRRVGGGAARRVDQVADLVRRAEGGSLPRARRAGPTTGSSPAVETRGRAGPSAADAGPPASGAPDAARRLAPRALADAAAR